MRAEREAPSVRLSPEGEPLTTLVFDKPQKIELLLLKIKQDTGITVTAMGTAKGALVPAPRLRDVTVKEALEWLKAQGRDWVFWHREDSTDWFIGNGRLGGPLLHLPVQRIIRPRSLSAGEVRKAVERMITPDIGQITHNEATNQITVTDFLPVVAQIELKIRLLDEKAERRAKPENDDNPPQGAVEDPGGAISGPELPPPPPGPTRLLFDDFDGRLSLDWEVLNRDSARYSLAKNPGALTITTQDGGLALEHQVDYENLFLVDCPDTEGRPFQVTICLASFQPEAHWNQAGLIFYNDDDNYLRCTYQRYYGPLVFAMVRETEGRSNHALIRPTMGHFEKVWLRVTKRGNHYELETSTDGESFERQGEATWGDGRVGKVGLLAVNGSGTAAPNLDASFESFEIAALPKEQPAVRRRQQKRLLDRMQEIVRQETAEEQQQERQRAQRREILAQRAEIARRHAEQERVQALMLAQRQAFQGLGPQFVGVQDLVGQVPEQPGARLPEPRPAFPELEDCKVLQKREYLHRSHGRDSSKSQFAALTNDRGDLYYTVTTPEVEYLLAFGKNRRPALCKYRGASFAGEYDFKDGKLVWIREDKDGDVKRSVLQFAQDALPDFNSKLDPYLVQRSLIASYDFDRGGKQMIDAYDLDSRGLGVCEYKISLELVDGDGVKLPNGKFKARHLLQVQETEADTWHEKERGNKTEYWVNDALEILRVYRHREPYELVMVDYDNAADLISRDETAVSYTPAPPPDPVAAAMPKVPQGGGEPMEVLPPDRASTISARATAIEEEPTSAPSVVIPAANLEIPDDCALCAGNLRKIHGALQKYKSDRGRLPDWLSDLVPAYLAAADLTCPADTGVVSPLPPDPKADCSYGYQFPPARDPMIGKNYRDWKSNQRTLYGDVVPLVRCGHHDDFLNLAWDGRLYVSGGLWETLFDAQVKERAVTLRKEGKLGPVNEKYEKDMVAFIDEMNRTYPYFDLKGIRAEWQEKSKELKEKVRECKSDVEFVDLVLEAIRCLRDGHMGFRELKVEYPQREPEYCPGVTFLPATEDRVCVMYARDGIDPDLKTGTIVTKIDGVDARKFLDDKAKAIWKAGGHFSSPQRARMYEYRIPLRGKQGDKHTIAILAGGKKRTIEMTCDQVARGWPHTYNMPAGLKRIGRSSFYARLPSGVGYVYLRRVDSSVIPCLKEAVETFPGAKGWIVDLRGNGGGGYSSDLKRQLAALPQPVAGIIDPGTFSAGETLARDVVKYARARLFGSNTAGSSGSKRGWSFPSGIGTLTVASYSWGGLTGPVEYNGIAPHVEVEADPEEVAAGKNSATLRAAEYLLESIGSTTGTRTTETRPPPRPTPKPLPKFDVSSIPGETIFKGRYQHRSRGRDYFVGDVTVKRQADGTTTYISDAVRFMQILTADKNNTPIEFRVPSVDGSYDMTAKFAPGQVTRHVRRAGSDDERSTSTVSETALPDFNSRPDPYCTQHVLLRHYDFGKGGKQTFTVFDTDSVGKGYAEYEIELDYVGDEDVEVPAGKFKARHLVLKQLTRSNTWYKKYPGLITDFWIAPDDYTIYRIYRRREPYELLLIEVETPK